MQSLGLWQLQDWDVYDYRHDDTGGYRLGICSSVYEGRKIMKQLQGI